MIKDFKEDPILKRELKMLPFLMLFVVLILVCISEFKKPEFTEQDYYNKFCTKHFDVSCDKIKIK